MNHTFYKIIKVSFYVFLVVSLIITLATIGDYRYIIGWIAGSFAAVTGFTLSYIIINKFSFYGKTKKQGFWFGIFRIIIISIYEIILFITIISINTYFSTGKIFWFKMPVRIILNPINFYMYLAGINLILFSIIIWELWIIWKKKDAKIYRCNQQD